MKWAVGLFMYTFSATVGEIGMAATHWIIDPDNRLIFVMVVTPLIMNAFQFWVQDSFLKWKIKNENEPKYNQYNRVHDSGESGVQMLAMEKK